MRNALAWDTETALFRPGVMAPELACVSWQHRGGEPILSHWTVSERLIRGWLESDKVLVGHNVAYDCGVICANFPDLIPAIFEAYDSDRITDTMIRQQLLDIAAGCYRGKLGEDNQWIKYDYSLFAVTRRLTGRLLEKDEWRLRYGEFRELPLDQWPEGARNYPLDDAVATLDCFEAQEQHAEFLKDQFAQARAAWWLHLVSCWGLRTSAEGVERLRVETEAEIEEVQSRLVAAGLVRADGSRDLKAAAAWMEGVCTEAQIPVRRTAPSIKFPDGNIQLDADACKATGDDTLEDYALFTELGAVLNKDLPALAAGTVWPVHTHYGIAETGRTTSSHPNVQNWRRRVGIRECFIPRIGKVFFDADYNALELHTLAQACITLLGKSHLAEVLNAGQDPHTAMASELLGISYEEASKRVEAGDEEADNARQTAKVANFGLPGGLGPRKLVLYARKAYKVDLGRGEGEDAAIENAKVLKRRWFDRWPEMRPYFAHVESLKQGDAYVMEQLFSGRVRGGATYTAACNGYFQALAADLTKSVGFLLSKACYVDRRSPMFGSRLVVFAHDEYIGETDDSPVAHDVATEQARIMVEGARRYLPDVKPKAKPLLMRVWSKKAKALHAPDGRLLPWSPA